MRSALKDFLTLFFFDQCRGCNGSLIKGEDVLCTKCLSELPRTNYHFHKTNPVTEKMLGRLQITNGFAFLKFSKKGIVQNLLHNLKYYNKPEIGEKLGIVFGNELINTGYSNQFDLIVPIPLHRTRQRHRGYNQSTMFANGLSKSMGIAFDEKAMERILASSTQTKKSKLERWENVKNIFRINKREQISQKRILLVDDIITTGSTLEACGQHLLKNGCSELSVACIALSQ